MLKKQKRVLIIITATLVLVLCGYRFSRIIEEYEETVLKNCVCADINGKIKSYVTKNQESFADMVTHEYNKDGKLCAIQLNGGKLAVLESCLKQEILLVVSGIEERTFSVPMGNIFYSELFAGRGPVLNIKTVPLTTLSCDTVNEFESVGINHTIHKLGLIFKISFKAATPFATTEFETVFEITLCESIIIGDVPDVYVS